eukprot:90112-Hanusia_phi.AAC.2
MSKHQSQDKELSDMQIENFSFLSMHATMDEEIEIFNWADELRESLRSCATCCSASKECDVCKHATGKGEETFLNSFLEDTMGFEAKMPVFNFSEGLQPNLHQDEENTEMEEETENVVKVYPKKRRGSTQEAPPVEITHEMLSEHFHEPLETAAARIVSTYHHHHHHHLLLLLLLPLLLLLLSCIHSSPLPRHWQIYDEDSLQEAGSREVAVHQQGNASSPPHHRCSVLAGRSFILLCEEQACPHLLPYFAVFLSLVLLDHIVLPATTTSSPS